MSEQKTCGGMGEFFENGETFFYMVKIFLRIVWNELTGKSNKDFEPRDTKKNGR